jgi:hypothetical protein
LEKANDDDVLERRLEELELVWPVWTQTRVRWR